MKLSLTLALLAVTIAPAAMAADASAAQSVTKACAAKYQADKAANKLAGQTWTQYLAACGKEMATPVVAAPTAAETKAAMKAEAKTVAKNAKEQAKTKATKAMDKMAPAAGAKQPTPAQQAMYDRMRKCGEMWQADKAKGKTGTMTWPQYWDACSDKLKK